MNIETLKEDYERRIKALNNLIENTPIFETSTQTRLATKLDCYRNFLVELDRIEEQKQ